MKREQRTMKCKLWQVNLKVWSWHGVHPEVGPDEFK